MKKALYVTLLFLAYTSAAVDASADSTRSPLERNCGEFRDSQSFVTKSSLYCLKRNSRSCDREARRMFVRCEFAGDYDDLSRRAHEGMLFALVLVGAPRLGSKLGSQFERP